MIAKGRGMHGVFFFLISRKSDSENRQHKVRRRRKGRFLEKFGECEERDMRNEENTKREREHANKKKKDGNRTVIKKNPPKIVA